MYDHHTIRRARWAVGEWELRAEILRYREVGDDLRRRVTDYNNHAAEFDGIVAESAATVQQRRPGLLGALKALYAAVDVEQTVDDAGAVLRAEQQRYAEWGRDLEYQRRLIVAERAALGEQTLTARPDWAYAVVGTVGMRDADYDTAAAASNGDAAAEPDYDAYVRAARAADQHPPRGAYESESHTTADDDLSDLY